MFQWLVKNRTQIGTIALSLLGAAGTLDQVINGKVDWMPEPAYIGLGAFVAGITGAFYKAGAKRLESKVDLLLDVKAGETK